MIFVELKLCRVGDTFGRLIALRCDISVDLSDILRVLTGNRFFCCFAYRFNDRFRILVLFRIYRKSRDKHADRHKNDKQYRKKSALHKNTFPPAYCAGIDLNIVRTTAERTRIRALDTIL